MAHASTNFAHRLGVLLLIALLAFSPAATWARHVEMKKASTQEVIDEVGEYTGIAADTLQAIRGQSPDLLENLKDSVTAIKVIDLYAQARDDEALTKIYEWQVGKLQDKAMEMLLPQNMVMLIAAVKAYKSALEALRDKVVIPAVEERIYQRYRSARGGKTDYTSASPEEAYLEATTGRDGYFMAKHKMFDALVQYHNYNPKLIAGGKVEANLWKQVDSFWMNRMEARHLKELNRGNRDALVNDVWKNSKRDLDRLRKAAAQIQQPPKPDEKKAAKAKPEDDIKQLKKALKGLFDDIDPPKEKRQEKAAAPKPAAQEPASTLNYRQKSTSSAPSVRSGEKVQSCSVCGPSGMDCVCGRTTCVCCARSSTCWPD